ncbi:hypothetical protein CsSME_00024213 [Camellia sinensis var. sinensis]
MDPNQPAIQQQRESLIPGVNQEAPLKELHDELLGLAHVLSPKTSQIIEEVERKALAAKIPVENVEPVKTEEVQSLTPMAPGSKKKKSS